MLFNACGHHYAGTLFVLAVFVSMSGPAVIRWLGFSCGMGGFGVACGISVLGGFLLVLGKFSFWPGNWALGCHSMGFGRFPDIF